jgi:spore germination protein KC
MRRGSVVRWMVAALLLCVALTGCWDEFSFPDRASALMIGLTYARQPDQWAWSFYFPNPTVTVSSLAQISTKDQTYTVTVHGPTLAAAYAKVHEHLARDLYLGQLEAVVWSDDMPSREVRAFVEAYNREGLTPKTVFVATAPKPLARVMAPNPQVVMPFVYLPRYFSCQACQATILTERLWQVWDAFETPGVSPVVPYVTGTQTVNRIAVYPLQGPPVLFTREETLGWGYLAERVGNETVTVHIHHGLAGLTRLHGTVEDRVSLGGGRLIVHVDVKLLGEVAQWPGSGPITPADLHRLETAGAHVVLRQCLAAIRRAQATHTDPFGYARLYLFQHPTAANEMPPGRWTELPYTVHLRVNLLLQETGVST